MNSKKSLDQRMVDHWIKGGLHLLHLVGDYPLGLVMVKCYVDGHAGQTVDTISAIIGGYLSDDTIRRRANKMVNRGFATSEVVGRQRIYRIRPDLAQQAVDYMRGEAATHPKP